MTHVGQEFTTRSVGGFGYLLSFLQRIFKESLIAEGIGCLYVLEGSTLGGQFILRALQERLGLSPDREARFFASYGKHVGSMWKSFGSFAEQYAATHPADLSITQVSDNTRSVIGIEPEALLSQPIETIVSEDYWESLRQELRNEMVSFSNPLQVPVVMNGERTIFDAVVNRHDQLVLLELENPHSLDPPSRPVLVPNEAHFRLVRCFAVFRRSTFNTSRTWVSAHRHRSRCSTTESYGG